MLTFREWLEEAAYHFQKGKDQDYTNDPYSVLVFSETAPDNYEVKGKTHGKMSHAIKHLKEFEPVFVDEIVKKAKDAIRKKLEEKPHWFCKVWHRSKGFETESGVSAVNKATNDEVLNTLDLINDKVETNEKLMPLDASLKKFAQEITTRYGEIISEKIDKAYDLDKTAMKASALKKKISKTHVIQFSCKGKSGGDFVVIIDFTDQSLLISKKDVENVTTMYRFNNTGTSKSSVVKGFFEKRLIPDNKELEAVLKDMM